jgi:hypothetical protein
MEEDNSDTTNSTSDNIESNNNAETTDTNTNNDTAIDTSDITKTITENVTIEKKLSKEKKSAFSSECSHCSKSFKSKPTFDKHINLQSCYKQDEISYCKVCCLLLESHSHYKAHLFTMEHLNNIGYSKLEMFNKQEVSKIHLVDPYLNSNDVNKISKNNLGDSFTFVFNKGNTKTINLVNNINNIEINNNVISGGGVSGGGVSGGGGSDGYDGYDGSDRSSNGVSDGGGGVTNTNSEVSNGRPHTQSPEPSLRQLKIIKILEKQVFENSEFECGKLFYNMLDNKKLQIEDYKHLHNIIKNLGFSQEYKDEYSLKINEFISMLVKQKTKGEILYKDKDISQLVINLSS